MTSLSLLDLATVVEGGSAGQALAETTAMAQAADRLGLTRLWVAEHHGMPGVASSAPAVLLAHLASQTTSIRVGSGGVMLPNHAPLVIAEQFGTLEALHPGRIDLGLGRAPGTTPATARALGRRNSNDFPDQVIELMSYFTGQAEHLAMPGQGLMPEVWLLGSSTYSAQLAGMLGLPFAFAYHFSPDYLEAAVALYQTSFQPSAVLAEPKLMLTVAAICAPTGEEASWIAGPSQLSTLLIRMGKPTALMDPSAVAAMEISAAQREEMERLTASHIVGEPDVVATRLHRLADQAGASEIMLSTRLFAVEDRIRSLELIADAWGSNVIGHAEVAHQ